MRTEQRRYIETDAQRAQRLQRYAAMTEQARLVAQQARPVRLALLKHAAEKRARRRARNLNQLVLS